MRISAALLLGLLFLAACTAQPTPAPQPGPNTPQPTQPTITYREPAEVITAQNANRLAYLGRLDPTSSRPSTIFAHDFSPDGIALATLDNDQLTVWDLLQGRAFFSTSREQANRVYFAPDKADVYTVDSDGTLRIIDVTTGTAQNSLRGHDAFSGGVAFYDFDGWLALGGIDGSFKVWDVVQRTSLVTVAAGDLPIDVLAFSPDGRLLASGTQGGSAQVWDWRERTQLASYDHEEAALEALAFSPDGRLLATATRGFVAMWRVPDAAASADADHLIYTVQIEPGGASDIFTFTPDGRYLIFGGGNANLLVIDPRTGRLIARLPEVSGDRMSAAFSPDGDLMVTTVLDRGVYLWNLAQATDETVPRATLEVPSRRIVSSAWSDDGLSLAFFDALGPVYIWGIAQAAS